MLDRMHKAGFNPHSVMVMAATIYGEARGEVPAGKEAVAWVIRNRADKGGWWGKTIVEVCLKPWQFSCWNDNDPNSRILKSIVSGTWDKETYKRIQSEPFQDCLAAAMKILYGMSIDPTKGATHYYATYIPEPKWAKGKKPSFVVGVHKFYKDVE